MTPDEIAQHLHAHRAGPNKWVARCPAHDDRSPSLSIAAGRDGRTLLHCFAGCAPEAIVTAAGLTMASLFSASMATPVPFQQVASERTRRAAEEQDRRRQCGQLLDQVRRLSRVVDALGRKLAYTADNVPGGDALTKLFHASVERLRAIEAVIKEMDDDDHC